MQKYQLLLLVCCLAYFAQAQEFYESFRRAELLTCPFDTGVQVVWPEGWSVYHTKNNLWNGEIDSAWCISVELLVAPPYKDMYLNAEEIDGERPVFIRYTGLQFSPEPLPENMLYVIESLFIVDDFASLIIDHSTPPASGILLSVDIPAENFIDRDNRIRFLEFQDSVAGVFSSNCFASEKFVDQSLNELVIALSIRHTQTKGQLIELKWINLYPVYEFDVLTQHEVAPFWWVDTSYAIPIYALTTSGFSWNFLLPYTSMAYPSSEHPSYYDVGPEVQVDTQQTITLVIDEYASLTPQPFASLRGALVAPSDTLRHRVELLNNGGNMCIQAIELTFGGDTKYRHKAGRIDLRGDGSCMMFKAGATFELAEGAQLNYGSNGMGFLAMKQGSQMILRDGAEMTINNTLVLQLSPTADHTQPTVFLYPGSTLRFSPEGSLEAWGSDELRLRVMLLGGIIDDSALSEHERALIERVYPDKPVSQLENLVLVKDPSQDALRIYMHVTEETEGIVSITDLSGRIIFEETTRLYPGYFYHALDLASLPAGWFAASVRTGDSYLSAPFTHIH